MTSTTFFPPSPNSAPATALVPGVPSFQVDKPAVTPGHSAGEFWKSAEGFGFRDLLDVINPLQHLPIVGTVYRAITGDNPGTGSRLVGGAIFGGPIGFASALINSIVETDTGKDIGAHALALFDDSKDTSGVVPSAAPQVAQNYPRLSHGDEETSPIPGSPFPSYTRPAPAAPAPQRLAMAFPTLSHGDEQLLPAPGWLPPPPVQTAGGADQVPDGAASAGQPGIPLQFQAAPQALTGMAALAAAAADMNRAAGAAAPGAGQAASEAAKAPVRTQESVGQLFGQQQNRNPQGPQASRGSIQTFSAGIPGSGIKGMPQPLPSTPAGWTAAGTPAAQAALPTFAAEQQLPVAVGPDQVPGAMLQALQKYDMMKKSRTLQGEQVSTLN